MSLFEPLFPALPHRATSYNLLDAKSGRMVECHVARWQPHPRNPEIIVHLRLDCPDCGYPLVVPVKGFFEEGPHGPSFAQVIACPGRWHPTDSATGLLRNDAGMTRCGWSGVIRQGALHQPGCGHANFVARVHTPGVCSDSCDESFVILNRVPHVDPDAPRVIVGPVTPGDSSEET